jgi:molybdopterin/thiamine biosynthesis adenylyltransferase
MNASIASTSELVATRHAPGIPAVHPAQASVFARHAKVPGHRQDALRHVRIGMVGCGGLNSWAALGLLRSGATSLTLFDDDHVERTNFARQLFFADDECKPKAHSLVDNLVGHAVGGGTLTGIALTFEDAIERFPMPLDVLVVGVDNNICRLACVKWARNQRIPAVFTMLSTDGLRCGSFLQGSDPVCDPCLWCAQPNLDPEETAECGVGSIITSCLLASALTVYFVHRAVMGWPNGVEPFTWREADLTGMVPDRIVNVRKRPNCIVCQAR